MLRSVALHLYTLHICWKPCCAGSDIGLCTLACAEWLCSRVNADRIPALPSSLGVLTIFNLLCCNTFLCSSSTLRWLDYVHNCQLHGWWDEIHFDIYSGHMSFVPLPLLFSMLCITVLWNIFISQPTQQNQRTNRSRWMIVQSFLVLVAVELYFVCRKNGQETVFRVI